MNKTKLLLLLSALLLTLSGCATHEKFVKKNNAWVGQNISSLIAQKGYPDRTMELPNKNKVYVYEKSRVYTTPNMGFGYRYGYYGGPFHPYGYGMGIHTDIMQETCKLFIETNKKGKILKWGARGNSCRSN